MKRFLIFVFVISACIFVAFLFFGNSNSDEKQAPPAALPTQSEAYIPRSPVKSPHTGDDAIYPPPTRTPGAINPDITQDNIGETICNPDWSTKSIRPPSSYTGRLKREQLQEWNPDDTNPKDYEEDHFIPLELGGNPTDPKNLWPEAYEPKPGAREKDRVENWLHKEICNNDITLDRAQKIIVEDWYSCYLNVENHQLCK